MDYVKSLSFPEIFRACAIAHHWPLGALAKPPEQAIHDKRMKLNLK